jgi:DNA adenine methylase
MKTRKITNDAATHEDVNATPPSPFVKWAGGKRALLSEILQRTPIEFGTYFEPFLGGGAVFLSLPAHLPKVGNDANTELVATYLAIRDDVDEVLRQLRQFQNTKDAYLEIRAWDRSPNFGQRSRFKRAARFIYLNKCGFNGLHRVNANGHHNVPYGYSPRADFIQEQNLPLIARFLRSKTGDRKNAARITSMDYQMSLQVAKVGDFVYLDPPYQPISRTSSFVSYLQSGFTHQDQVALRDQVVDLTSRGVHVLLSNSDADEVHSLYSDTKLFTIDRVQVRRYIAADSRKRKKVYEVLISNYKASRGRRCA